MALKILLCYLKQTKDCGLVLDPNYDVCKVDEYPDANFSGMYGHEKPNDIACVNICTSFIITFAYFLVLWVSKLQINNDLSTMESEIIGMYHCFT